MNPTPQQKRFAGAVILMLLFCILVPFFVSGENVNRDSEAITRLSDLDARRQFEQEKALERIREEERQRLIAQMQEEEKIRTANQNTSSSSEGESGSAEPVIIENNNALEDDKRKQQELVAQRNREKAEAEERRRREQEAKQQALREQQARRLEAQRREQELRERKKADELASRQNAGKITVINENTKKRNEIAVITPSQAEQRRQNSSAPVQPVSRPGEKYLIRIGVFSSMTNAKNAQSSVSKVCKSSIYPSNGSGGQRMFKVVCGPSNDMAAIRSMQTKLNSIVGSTTIEKAN
jgi:cell division septation protein DedD